ncbi:MAG: bifunctional adenosylcobinamide kinase/adenosylcobinamide-phosphate guanylyltransferase [Bacillota bacterium]
MSDMSRVIMVVGGCSSGKSVYAEKLAGELAGQNGWEVVYVATGTIWDEEFDKRVEKHRTRRPASWQTIEEPVDLHNLFNGNAASNKVYLVDGVGTWVANLMYRGFQGEFIWDEQHEEELLGYLHLFINSLNESRNIIILVADETGMGVVPDNLQARIFRDLNGMVNQKLAEKADEVFMVVCGIPIKIK